MASTGRQSGSGKRGCAGGERAGTQTGCSVEEGDGAGGSSSTAGGPGDGGGEGNAGAGVNGRRGRAERDCRSVLGHFRRNDIEQNGLADEDVRLAIFVEIERSSGSGSGDRDKVFWNDVAVVWNRSKGAIPVAVEEAAEVIGIE